MRFLSICSGIEAASVAFHPLGWRALAFAEIEPFPCRLLAHHYPQVPNLGDLTRWRDWSPELLAQADVLCGGTPCQAFSVAGLRGSLNDERGNLTLTFCHLYDEIDRQRHLCGRPPAVCLWENVPGVLNTPDNAFGHFLAGLAGEDVPLTPPGARWTDAGYVRGPRRAVAWRVLDAQYFGLAQRRERVFVVASADPAFDPAAVLFELDGLRRDTPPRRGAGEGAAHELAPSLTSSGRGVERPGESRGQDPVIAERVQFSVLSSQFSVQNGVPEVAGTLSANGKAAGSATQQDEEQGMLIPLAFGGNNTAGPIPTIPTIPALNANRGCHNPGDFEAGALLVERAESGGRRVESPEAFAFKASHFTRGKDGAPAPTAPPLSADADKGDQDTLVAYEQGSEVRSQKSEVDQSFAFDLRGREGGAIPEGPHATANLRAGSGGSSRSYVAQKAESGGRRAESGEPLPFDTTQITSATNRSKPCAGDPFHPIASQAHPPAVAFEPAAYTLHGSREGTQAVASPTDTAGTIREGTGTAIQNSSTTVALSEVAQPLRSNPHNNSDPSMEATMHVLSQPRTENREPGTAWRVRRLTPEECEILQGFPVGYTLIPGTSSKKRKTDDLSDTIDYLMSLGLPRAEAEVLAHSPDGPRYKALGNSWAVPVARWIARRIDAHLTRQTSNPSTP